MNPLPRIALSLAGLAAALVLAGCATTGARIQARIDEKPEVFAKLTKQQQKDIKWGYVRHGFTPDMVYFAYGKPDQIITSPDSDSYVWVFVDRSHVNDEFAKASALRSASQGNSIMARTDGGQAGRTEVWPGHDANFKTDLTKDQTFPIADQNSRDIYTNIDATKDLPTIWVAFKDNLVVNVQRFGDHEGTADKTGSLGG